MNAEHSRKILFPKTNKCAPLLYETTLWWRKEKYAADPERNMITMEPGRKGRATNSSANILAMPIAHVCVGHKSSEKPNGFKKTQQAK